MCHTPAWPGYDSFYASMDRPDEPGDDIWKPGDDIWEPGYDNKETGDYIFGTGDDIWKPGDEGSA